MTGLEYFTAGLVFGILLGICAVSIALRAVRPRSLETEDGPSEFNPENRISKNRTMWGDD